MQLAKPERHRLIESVVSRKRVGTQFELLDALSESGCAVTQATISRDIRELGLEKTHDQFGRKVVPAGNIVVLQSDLGAAPAIARALDQLGHDRVVGTLAGDDTVLVVAPSERDARTLARELGEILG
jgi:transcriptional regulator of arginine metabolism